MTTATHFEIDADYDDVRLHVERMTVNDTFTIQDFDGGVVTVRRYSADDYQYTPGDRRTRIGSLEEIMGELFPEVNDYH